MIQKIKRWFDKRKSTETNPYGIWDLILEEDGDEIVVATKEGLYLDILDTCVGDIVNYKWQQDRSMHFTGRYYVRSTSNAAFTTEAKIVTRRID